MRILFVCDYFPPFTKGGGEISSYWQAKKLSRQGIRISILAPRFRDKVKEKKEKFKIYWYSVPWRLKTSTAGLFLNPVFISYLFWLILKTGKQEKIDLIHCQGKYSSPAVILARYFLKAPVLITLRDYKGICNHGFCLKKSKQGCNLISFFKKDFCFYYQHYIKNKNLFSFLIQMVLSYWGRINTLALAFFMKKADKFVCVSDFVSQVYARAGYDRKKMITIYNFSPEIKTKRVKIPIELKKKIDRYKHRFLYCGKLTLGKGADLLIKAGENLSKKRKDVLFIFSGAIYEPIKKSRAEHLVFLGQVKAGILYKIMSLVDIVCLPSVWPEPLSRTTIEAFSLAKPVLSSNVGGQKELVNEQTGWLFEPRLEKLEERIAGVLKERKKWESKGKRAKKLIVDLEKKQIKKLINLYQSFLS